MDIHATDQEYEIPYCFYLRHRHPWLRIQEFFDRKMKSIDFIKYMIHAFENFANIVKVNLDQKLNFS